MRNARTASMLFLVLFLGLQAGNMAGYLLCRLESAASETVRDCGCDTYLAGAFTQTDTGNGVAKAHWKSMLPEGMPTHACACLMIPATFAERCHAAYLFNLADPFADPAFHPPGINA